MRLQLMEDMNAEEHFYRLSKQQKNFISEIKISQLKEDIYSAISDYDFHKC
ncbi:MAG TPA: hypothetical protein VJB11_03325 [archaeon]|nr:hypothetical protein [archaeon]